AEDVAIVDLQGRLVTGGADEMLRKAMNQLIVEGKKRILLNLSRVSWIDSAGIGELIASIKLAKRFGASVKLLRVGDRVKHVLSISKLLPLLDVYENEKEALGSFGGEIPLPEAAPIPAEPEGGGPAK
ncbi:MAG: STAS domain-containing protein, partial [Acidobacteriota bacterium]